MRSLLRLAIISLVATPIWIAQTAIAAKHATVPKPIQPGPAVVREFALTALEHLKGPAQLPFLNLLKSLPAKQVGVTISGKATKNMSCAGGVCTPTAPIANLNVGDVTRLLRDGTLTIGTTAQAPDIFVNAPFSWVSGNGLTLQAIGSIVVNKAVSDSGPAPLSLTYNADGGGGMLSFGGKGHISFMSTGNALTINGQGYILANNIQSLAQLIARNPSGSFALSANYNAKHDGTYTQSPIQTVFQGKLEGLGNTITHLVVEDQNVNDQGTAFIYQTSGSAIVSNLFITSTTIDGYQVVGGLVADNKGTLLLDNFSGSVQVTSTGGPCIAGVLAGVNDGTISLSTTAGTVSDDSSCTFSYLGGLVGLNGYTQSGTINLGSSTAIVSAVTSSLAGGLVGWNVGWNVAGSAIATSFASGAVSALDASIVGGLVGENEGSISNSDAAGSAAAGNSSAAGGLVGYGYHDFGAAGSIDSCTTETAVSVGSNSNVGGALGWTKGIPVSNTVSYGTVTAGSGSRLGGFVGFDSDAGSTQYMSNDSWDMTASGITDPSQGAGNYPNDPGITGFD